MSQVVYLYRAILPLSLTFYVWKYGVNRNLNCKKNSYRKNIDFSK